ncbi:MAG: DUF397 domain-containing protein [Actinomycetota bacterium]|nr:DUF397 domain-containing protein [Actinomycetota bacterium]
MTEQPTSLDWRKSSYSSSSANCVEIATVGLSIAVRDSKDPDGPVLLCTRAGMAAFVAGVKNGEFDLA